MLREGQGFSWLSQLRSLFTAGTCPKKNGASSLTHDQAALRCFSCSYDPVLFCTSALGYQRFLDVLVVLLTNEIRKQFHFLAFVVVRF